MLNKVKDVVKKFLELDEFKVISHYDTDGITSASIISRALHRTGKKFSLLIVKQLENEFIDSLDNGKPLLFLDLGSSHIEYFKNIKNKVFILDHHDIEGDIPENVEIINPHLFKEEPLSASQVCYLFAKELNHQNKDLAGLAVIGMVGDMLGEHLSRKGNSIIEDAEVMIKKGLLLYPATRPLNKALEYSSSLYIPGVTGSYKGALNLLREVGIERFGSQYPSLVDLNEEEMSKLITAVLLRRTGSDNEKILGNIYLVKFFNKLEDARDLSATINACSRLGYSETALALCLGNKKARKRAEKIYVTYKKHLVDALNFVEGMKKQEGKDYVIINAKDQIKDTIIGTIASILSTSRLYETGTVIITMAYAGEKIKASARVAGRKGRNVHEVLESVIGDLGGECGGHEFASGCLINKQDEEKFINLLKKKLDVEVVKV